MLIVREQKNFKLLNLPQLISEIQTHIQYNQMIQKCSNISIIKYISIA